MRPGRHERRARVSAQARRILNEAPTDAAAFEAAKSARIAEARQACRAKKLKRKQRRATAA